MVMIVEMEEESLLKIIEDRLYYFNYDNDKETQLKQELIFKIISNKLIDGDIFYIIDNLIINWLSVYNKKEIKKYNIKKENIIYKKDNYYFKLYDNVNNCYFENIKLK